MAKRLVKILNISHNPPTEFTGNLITPLLISYAEGNPDRFSFEYEEVEEAPGPKTYTAAELAGMSVKALGKILTDEFGGRMDAPHPEKGDWIAAILGAQKARKG